MSWHYYNISQKKKSLDVVCIVCSVTNNRDKCYDHVYWMYTFVYDKSTTIYFEQNKIAVIFEVILIVQRSIFNYCPI